MAEDLWPDEQGVRSDIQEIRDRVDSDTTLSNDDIAALEGAIDGSFATKNAAVDTILLLATDSPATIEDRYPEMVESLLSSQDEIAVAREFLHEAIQLRFNGVSLSEIRSGLELGGDIAREVLADISAETAGENGVFPGGGATEMQLASRLRDRADAVTGREQLVVETVADAVEAIPTHRAAKAGADPIDALVDLRAQHQQGNLAVGVDQEGELTDMDDEPDRIEFEQLASRLDDAVSAVELILVFEQSPPQLLRSEAVLAERL